MGTNSPVPPEKVPDHEYRRLVCIGCGHVLDVPIYCKDRFCPVCSAPRRNRVRERIKNIIAKTVPRRNHNWKLLTLTVASKCDPSEMLDVLQVSFRKFRQRSLWKKNFVGGVAVFETTRNNGLWHVHIHALVYGQFVAQNKLSRAWKAVSGSPIVDIRIVASAQASLYITKYLTKLDVDSAYRPVIADAFRGRRLFIAFGHAHKIPFVHKVDCAVCPSCSGASWMPLDVFCQVACNGKLDP